MNKYLHPSQNMRGEEEKFNLKRLSYFSNTKNFATTFLNALNFGR